MLLSTGAGERAALQMAKTFAHTSLRRTFLVPHMRFEDDFQVFEVGDSVRSKIDSNLAGTIAVYYSGAIGFRRNDGCLKLYHEDEFYRDFELERWDRAETHTPPPLYDG
jgi:hypothetical protein